MAEPLRTLFIQGLQALHTADERGRESAAEMADHATTEELKDLLQQGSDMADRHTALLNDCFRAVKETPRGGPNEIIDGILAAGRRMLSEAEDDASRDAGIIAQGQIALHYHIAAYGTLRSYAEELDLEDAAEAFDEMVDDCEELDERYTDLAETLINPLAAGNAEEEDDGDDDEEMSGEDDEELR